MENSSPDHNTWTDKITDDIYIQIWISTNDQPLELFKKEMPMHRFLTVVKVICDSELTELEVLGYAEALTEVQVKEQFQILKRNEEKYKERANALHGKEFNRDQDGSEKTL